MKSYGQWCSLAKALDIVGERWTLLVIRELLGGPKRYTDLSAGIPGISTDVLAARLTELQGDGVVVRRTLRPPAASKVYELTEMGRELAPALVALSKWGMRLLGTRRDDESFRPHWLVLGLQGMMQLDRAADVQLEVEFDLGGENARIRIDRGALTYVEDSEREPDIVVRSDLSTLAAIADGSLLPREAIEEGRLHIDGSRDALRSYGRVFTGAR